MKKALLIFWLIFPIFGYTNSIKGQDTLVYAKKEILTLEPLPYNTQTYTKFKKQKFYDYYNVRIQTKSILEILHEKFNEWLSRVFNKTLNRKEFDTLLWIAGIIILVVFGVIIYLNKPGIFYFNKKNPLTYSIEDEDIEIEDLDHLTEKLIKEKRFSDAIRLQYLKTLKILHEQDYISYDAHKTVNEYVYEIKDENLRKKFRNLSGEFVYYRYGKGEADAGKFSGFRTAAVTIQKMRVV
jgi:hypoxanthine phosphoribosyltransferase